MGVRAFYRRDRVTHTEYPGVWRIYSPHPRKSWYFIEPVDDAARKVADCFYYGIVGVSIKKIRHDNPQEALPL